MKIILLSFFFLLVSCTAFGQDFKNMSDSEAKARAFNDSLDDSHIKETFEEDLKVASEVFSRRELLHISYSSYDMDRTECRFDKLSDSLLLFYAKYDAFYSVKDSVKKYYVIGNASGSPFNLAPKVALEKYNLILVYTHCTPCKYQLKYSAFFEKFYFEKYGKDIEKLIYQIEEEIMVEERKSHKQMVEERKKKESQEKN